ncbi:hypothetical protein ES708_07441 [subsurface metagenome]
MAKKGKEKSCCAPTGIGVECCKVESLISVDERGQMMLPKEIIDRENIMADDKLAAVSWEKDGKVCYISTIASGIISVAGALIILVLVALVAIRLAPM